MNGESLKRWASERHIRDWMILLLTAVVIIQIEFVTPIDAALIVLAELTPVSDGRIAQLPTLLLLFVIIYDLLDDIYPSWMGHPIRQSRVVRLLMAAVGFWLAQILYLAPNSVRIETPGAMIISSPQLDIQLATAVGVLVLLVGYQAITDRPLSAPDSIVMQSMYKLSPSGDGKAEWSEELDTFEDRSQLLAQSVRAFSMFAVLLINTIPILVTGSLVGVLSRLYPLLEVLAVTRLVIRYVPDQRLTIHRLPSLDPETQIYSRLDLMRTLPGISVFLVVFFGTAQAMVMYVLLFQPPDAVKWAHFGNALTTLIAMPSFGAAGYVIESAGRVVSQTAHAITPLIIAIYSLWFWVRISQRSPQLISYYRTNAYPDACDETAVKPRPVGYLFPVLPLCLLFANHPVRPRNYLGVALDKWLYVVGFVGAMAIVVGSVFMTRRQDRIKKAPSAIRELYVPLFVTSLMWYLIFRTQWVILQIGVLILLSSIILYTPQNESSDRTNWWFGAVILAFGALVIVDMIPTLIFAVVVGVVLLLRLYLWIINDTLE